MWSQLFNLCVGRHNFNVFPLLRQHVTLTLHTCVIGCSYSLLSLPNFNKRIWDRLESDCWLKKCKFKPYQWLREDWIKNTGVANLKIPWGTVSLSTPAWRVIWPTYGQSFCGLELCLKLVLRFHCAASQGPSKVKLSDSSSFTGNNTCPEAGRHGVNIYMLHLRCPHMITLASVVIRRKGCSVIREISMATLQMLLSEVNNWNVTNVTMWALFQFCMFCMTIQGTRWCSG